MTDLCAYVLDGHDTDDTPWYRCVTHDELAPSHEAPCAGSTEPAYSLGLVDEVQRATQVALGDEVTR